MERLTKRIKFKDGTSTIDFSNEVIGKYINDHKAGVRALFKKKLLIMRT